MYEDEVLKEVHRAKDALGARFGFDVSRLVDYFIARQKQDKQKRYRSSVKKRTITALLR